MPDYRVQWVIPTWNGARLAETLASLPCDEPREIVDNKALRWPLARCWNFAVAKYLATGSCEVLIIANDDIIAREDTGQALAHGLLRAQHDPQTRALGEHPAHGRELLMVTCYNTRDHEDEGDRWGVGAPDYSCFAITRKTIEVCGAFDEEFMAYHEDNSSHYKIRMAGYEAAQWTPYFHYGSTTRSTDLARAAELDQVDTGLTYRRMWGGDPGHERFTRKFDPSSVVLPNPAYDPANNASLRQSVTA